MCLVCILLRIRVLADFTFFIIVDSGTGALAHEVVQGFVSVQVS